MRLSLPLVRLQAHACQSRNDKGKGKPLGKSKFGRTRPSLELLGRAIVYQSRRGNGQQLMTCSQGASGCGEPNIPGLGQNHIGEADAMAPVLLFNLDRHFEDAIVIGDTSLDRMVCVQKILVTAAQRMLDPVSVVVVAPHAVTNHDGDPWKGSGGPGIFERIKEDTQSLEVFLVSKGGPALVSVFAEPKCHSVGRNLSGDPEEKINRPVFGLQLLNDSSGSRTSLDLQIPLW